MDRRTRLGPALSALVMLGCGTRAPDVDLGIDAATPLPSTVGKDIDVRTPRSLLATGCKLPQAFYDALASFPVTPPQLAMPDWGLTLAKEPNRLHWTDEIRHQGDLAPSFACMVAGDVEAALALGDSDATVRELLVAQGIYGNRTAYQVSRYDRAITVDPAAQPLLGALERFYTHPPVHGDPSPPLPPWDKKSAAVAAQVSAFSPAAQVALAQAILGLLAAAEARDQALTKNGQLALADWQDQLAIFFAGKDGGNLADFSAAYKAANTMTQAMDYDLLARAGQLAVRSVESLRLALKDEPLRKGVTLDLTGPLGRIAVSLQAHDDRWVGTNFFLLVDGGGSDTYQDDIAVNADLFHPIAAVLDLAGNDQFVPSQPWDLLKDGLPYDGGQGTGQAAGWVGIAILDDAAGNDEYQAGFYQAYGLYGVGVLMDHGGDDSYKGYVRSQGAADFGYGLLVDRGGGKDKYESLHNSQGFGGTRGIGWLVDDSGDDSYLAVTTPIVGDPANSPYDKEGSNFSGAQGFGWGLRVWDQNGNRVAFLSGGLGGLFDLGGNDTYQCAVMCQAWGYFFGTGLLYDKSGNDSYTTWHKYGIGGATHQAIGVFIDGQGADHYEYAAGGIPTNGGSEGVGLGYDLSVGFHIDRGPEPDVYRFDMDKQMWGEVMGVARFPGFGVFINEGGDDEYHIPGKMGAYALGMSDIPYQTPPFRSAAGGTASTLSVGMFFDLGGKDTYDVLGSTAKNNASWLQRGRVANTTMDPWDPKLDHGYGLDGEAAWPAW